MTRCVEYFAKHLNAILKAMEEGVNVGGYYIWSLMDVLSWSNGYTSGTDYSMWIMPAKSGIRKKCLLVQGNKSAQRIDSGSEKHLLIFAPWVMKI